MDFAKIHRNSVESVRTEFKNWAVLFTISNFQKIIKMRKNTIKTRGNFKHSGENFFFKSTRFARLKFKLNQICKNGPTWPTTYEYRISSLLLMAQKPRDAFSPLCPSSRGDRWCKWPVHRQSYKNRSNRVRNRPNHPINRPRLKRA
jgi:hypothetical protein